MCYSPWEKDFVDVSEGSWEGKRILDYPGGAQHNHGVPVSRRHKKILLGKAM
jgi:hypothetical protein